MVTQLDGAPLGAVSAVEVSPAGKVYFAVAAAAGAENGLESALRTELLAHTATGCVYVYDPAARTVEKVLGGVAGAAGLALSPDGSTLYVSDLGSRCIWAVDAAARELTAGDGAAPLPLPVCRAIPERWLWTRTARCTSATAGAQRLAGKERGQHPAAGHCPAGGAEYAGAAVPVHRRCPLRRGGKPCNRGLGADLYRSCTGQLCGGVSGGKQSIFRCGRGRQPAGCKPISEVFFV